MRTQRVLLSALVVAVFALGAADAALIYVATTGNDVNNGSTPALALRNIQTAYDRANPNDEIRVAPGTYNECINALTDVGDPLKPVTFVAQAWLDSQNRTTTIIDGSGKCAHLNVDPVIFRLGTVVIGDGVELEGFTIRGNATGVFAWGSVVISNNVIEGGDSVFNGGGIYSFTYPCEFGDASVVISNNLIQNNVAVGNQPQGTFTVAGYGGGVFALAAAYNGGLPGCPQTGDADIQITGNTILNNSGKGWGGGMFAYTLAEPGRTASVVVTNNTIEGNDVGAHEGYYGYGGGLYLSTYGTGTETVEASNNIVRLNEATADGGGIAAWLRGRGQGNHTLTLDANTVTGNDADHRGGGLDLFAEAVAMVSPNRYDFRARNNAVTGNTALDTGGGVQITMSSQRTANLPTQHFEVSGSNISGNSSLDFGLGGGVAMAVSAHADPEGDGNTLPTEATVQFVNNRVTGNTADPPDGTQFDGVGTGGGVFALIQSLGEAVAELDFRLNTVADNTVDDEDGGGSFVGVGGIYLEAWTGFDTGVAPVEGESRFVMNSSIVSDNDGHGLGGSNPAEDGIYPPTGSTANFTALVRYSDVFGNPGGNYETWFGDRTGQNGNIASDPQLADLTYFPSTCSPAIDAGDPALPFAVEIPPGAAVNMGHTGNTTNARGLADPTGDGRVEGVDLLRLSVAFASTSGQPRFDATADFDQDDMVDGNDLALLTADFGDVCP